MGLRDIGATLPPGFRFYPSDEELVCHYLYKKICNEEALKGTLVEIDLHICEPWQLPEVAKLNANEWYFFSFRDRKYATGYRTNRATTSGYWKATGKDRTVIDQVTKEIVGMRKTLVFYRNRAPNGIKTGWIMHEFRLETPHMPPKEDWVLCRVFQKSKGSENSNEEYYSPQLLLMDQNNTSCAPPYSINLTSASSPPTDHQTTMPNSCGGCDQQIMTSFSSTPTHHNHGTTSFLNRLHNFSHDQKGASNYNPIIMATSANNHHDNSNININSTTSPRNSSDVDYGFLWDTNFDENISSENNTNNHGGMLSNSNFDEMRFEIDNSMVFL
ncbi:NAC domain-containing protein [Morus notabilis]|uniref:NAC domain-containing protein n=1 Tax=Morus notabilis TaxID=981085 RepID=W9RQU5_9ROSA|nr:protein CUP-SHAPED COTYLEDON 3 [Morus notabilis]EXB88378.1 NAC domain-containing protein [Morus notabilis]